MAENKDIGSKIEAVLTTFSSESFKAANQKVKELGIDPLKGGIPLQESFINLDAASRILADAITQKKLAQIPLTLQKDLLAKVDTISKHLVSLGGGADEVINLVGSIELLTAAIWQYRLDNLSSEVLGYQTKVNQLKHQEVLLTEIKERLESGLQLKTELEALLEATKKAQTDVKAALDQTIASSNQAQKTTQEITALSQTAAAQAATILQNETTSITQSKSATASAAQTQAIEKQIQTFFTEIESHRTTINTISTSSKTLVEENNAATRKLMSELAELEGKIKVQIENATGFSLFQSFQKRQEVLVKSKKFWAIALGICVVISLGLAVFLIGNIGTNPAMTVAFFLKLSLSIPVIYAISFCTVQYSRERKLEEEYAFKSAISISLDPHQNLVNRIVKQDKPEERQQFLTFIVDSIQRVFTSPTEILAEKKEEKGATEKALKQISTIVGTLARTIKP